MVFSSLLFICIFMPVSVIAYFLIGRLNSKNYLFLFLFCASLVFYGTWNYWYLILILGSIAINFSLGKAISVLSYKKILFSVGLIFNIGLLGYYKYTDFIICTVNSVIHLNLPLQNIILPIGISFFTFQQIAYLTDIYKGEHNSDREGIISYSLFVSFFPQLVAGPIVHHREMIPQFEDVNAFRVNWENIYKGFIIFSIGLGKKVIIADSLSPIVGQGFDVYEMLSFTEAFIASIAYSLQLYFDFSGYSDMAIGCALFFNIKLPWNFNSPYRALSVQDFWRRWHITLSRWLGQYIYIYIH